MSYKRLVPPDSRADAVSPTYLLAAAEDIYSTYSMSTSMAVPPIRWLAAPPPPGRMQRVPLGLHTRCSLMGLEVAGHLQLRVRKVPPVSAFWDAREQQA